MDYCKTKPGPTVPDQLRSRALATGGGPGSGGLDVKTAISRGHARMNRVCRTMPDKQAASAEGSAAAAIAFCRK